MREINKKTRIILVVLLSLSIATFLRESGILDLNLYQSKYQETHSFSISRTNAPDHYPFGTFLISFDDNITSEIKNAIKKQKTLTQANALTFNIISFDEKISGWLYCPFYKTPHVSYKYKFEAKGTHNSKEFELSGDLTGDIKFQILFLCSGNKAKELIYHTIAQQMVKSFEKEFKK